MDARDSKSVRELLDSYGIKASKSMGQNFLADANIPDKIVRLSGIDKTCGVLEVGPGVGALTGRLVKAAGRVAAVELDRKLAEILSGIFTRGGEAEIIQGDILRIDVRQLVTEKLPGLRPVVCANLPYNITTPVLTRLIEAGVFESITVMVQREVAQRICARPGTRDYGAISVFVQYHTAPQVLFDVAPECFIPKPKVFSSVVTLTTRAEKPLAPELEALFFRIVRAAFNQRRKTLVNALLSSFGIEMSKDEIAGFVQKCGFNVNVRGEQLSVADFTELSRRIGKKVS